MNTISSTCLCNARILKSPSISSVRRYPATKNFFPRKGFRIRASSNEVDTKTEENREKDVQEASRVNMVEIQEQGIAGVSKISVGATSTGPALDKDLKKVVQKTAATFAPRASTATKNPAVPGTVLYSVFEVQGYASMLLGGVLSFNLIFPSNEPDIWRLMGMWSIWMFTIPSLRARDCSKNEKEALNYLFLLIPLLNVIIPFFWKSFAVVWSADTVAFFGMYAWKLGWLQQRE
ncbi:resistance to phytophthora 1 [Abeliophyllum distichum]|uniref:Resistance to phytophthora 1 n=1 Tax=Abeliophyllum distichum TaxID=126358 RepID=A0ABD1RF53_9LAMI